ncbi:hypothetical protein [Gordonia sp. MP11Mi]|uniref:hypothetical protein n=1 Tax=Gordonia sp. MP11Mi TaxID=3022769 RepID=UPI003B217920
MASHTAGRSACRWAADRNRPASDAQSTDRVGDVGGRTGGAERPGDSRADRGFRVESLCGEDLRGRGDLSVERGERHRPGGAGEGFGLRRDRRADSDQVRCRRPIAPHLLESRCHRVTRH